MDCYKPTTLEENYSNVLNLRSHFINAINSFIWEYYDICNKYSSEFQYYQALSQGRINPYCNGYENELRMLACKIYGYTSNVFETLAYALDFWRKQTDINLKNRNITDKEYDQAIKLLCLKKKINGNDKENLLAFRLERNYCTHFGRVVFCQYIFHNANALFNLLNIICALLGEMPIDKNVFSDFQAQQGNYIEEMKLVLGDFALSNLNIA